MHEKSVVDGSSGRGLRGSDRPFVRLWNRVGKQRRFGAYTVPLWSPLVVRPLVLVLSGLILCWLLSLWSSLVLASLVFIFCGLLLSCVPLSCLILCWLLSLSSSLVLACLVFVFCGQLLSCLLLSWSQRALGASWKASGSPPGGSWDRFWPLLQCPEHPKSSPKSLPNRSRRRRALFAPP